LPELFRLHAGRFYLQMASEVDRPQLYPVIKQLANDKQLIFIGVIDPIHPMVESVARARDRVLEAPSFLPVEQARTLVIKSLSPRTDSLARVRTGGIRIEFLPTGNKCWVPHSSHVWLEWDNVSRSAASRLPRPPKGNKNSYWTAL
jgi:hypothetical protein